MNKFRTIIIFLIIIAVALVAGIAFLSFWDPPAPTGHVEKDLPSDALQK